MSLLSQQLSRLSQASGSNHGSTQKRPASLLFCDADAVEIDAVSLLEVYPPLLHFDMRQFNHSDPVVKIGCTKCSCRAQCVGFAVW